MRKKIFSVFCLILSLLLLASCAVPGENTDVLASDSGLPGSVSSASDSTGQDVADSSTVTDTGSGSESSVFSDAPTDTDVEISTDSETEREEDSEEEDSSFGDNPFLNPAYTDSSSAGSTTSGSENNSDTVPERPKKTVSDLVIACDQTVGRVVVYDLERYSGDLENCIVWSYTPAIKSGSTVHRSKLMSGVKFRTDTVFGDVVLMCASGRYAEVVTYPDKTVIWRDEWTLNNVDQQDKGVKNPHSIEILPSGNVLVAGSSGNIIRLFYTSARINNPNAKVSSVKYELTDAHGLLWDPEYETLWALGSTELVAYKLSGSGTGETLVKSKSYPLPTAGGHDLTADFTSVDHLWLSTGSAVYRFDKATGRFDTSYDHRTLLNRASVKGFGNNVNGHFFMTFPNGGTGTSWASESFASWCTNRIRYFYYDASGKLTQKDCVSSAGAFYKVYSFQGQYQ